MTTPALISVTSCARAFRWFVRNALVIATACALQASAQAPAATPSEMELENLVGRIALYPDDLVGIILPASTNPTQVVQADRYLDKRKANPNLAVDEKWDDAIKSLLNYPVIIKTMSTELDWTADLGVAVATDLGAVLDAVQAFRRKAQAAGNLKSDVKTVIVIEKEVIKIVPADPQVIYVPQYNPTTVVVYGAAPTWGYWPSPYPVYYYPYPPGAPFAAGLVWGAAISSAWRGNHYVAHYGGNGGNNNININRNINTGNVNINTGNINTGNRVNTGNVGAGNTQWNSNKTAGQLNGSVNSNVANRASYGGAGGASAAARPATQPASSSAFGGYGSGQKASMESTRGAASRGSMATTPRAGRSGGGGRGRR